MKQFNQHWTTKGIVFFLAAGLLWGGQSIFPQGTGLEGLFKWAINNYREGKYLEVSKDLELLLSYCDEGHNQLKGKIYLLLGAVYEQLGVIKKARQNYQHSLELLENPTIEGIDLTSLPEYQNIIMKKQHFQREKTEKSISRPKRKKPMSPRYIKKQKRLQRKIIEKTMPGPRKKKRISPMIIIAGGALLVGLAVILLSKKAVKTNETDSVPESDYDTQQLGIEWIQIPGGEFIMGDNFNEGEEDELPLHAVFLDEYHISKYEVTFAQYDKYCEDTGEAKPDDNGWGRGNRPVINVSRQDVWHFCSWLTQKTGKNINLPSEAQWENAARSTDQRRYPWGNSPPDCSKANYDCDNQTHPVGSHPAGVSPYGLHDMAGNVSEWCRDVYDSLYYRFSPYSNPVYTIEYYEPTNPFFSIRGGSWTSNHLMGIRCADRGNGYQTEHFNTVGFRLAKGR